MLIFAGFFYILKIFSEKKSIFTQLTLTNSFIMYLLKIKGTSNLPDFVQLRDENMKLLAYFTPGNAEKSLVTYGFKRSKRKKLMKEIPSLDYGILTKIQTR